MAIKLHRCRNEWVKRKYPVIEFEDGRAYRAESKDMAARIRSGKLLDEAGPAGPPALPDPAGRAAHVRIASYPSASERACSEPTGRTSSRATSTGHRLGFDRRLWLPV